jgi:hypothetical protein
MAIWYILWPLGNVVVICYIFLCLGILCQEKSDNPGSKFKIGFYKYLWHDMISLFDNNKNAANEVTLYNSIAMHLLKTLHTGGIRTDNFQ